MQTRWARHLWMLKTKKHRTPALQAAYDKYGSSAFSHQIILVCQKDKNILTIYEQAALDLQIKIYGDESVYNCHKLCVTSRAGMKNTPEHNRALADSIRGRKKSLEEIQAHIARFKGKKLKPESIAKRTAKQTGIKRSPETIAKMSACRIGKKLSPEHCAQIGASKAGTKMHPNTRKALADYYIENGKTHTSPEQIAKLADMKRGVKLPAEQIARRQETRKINAIARGYW